MARADDCLLRLRAIQRSVRFVVHCKDLDVIRRWRQTMAQVR